jgi:hypothetical protein
MNKLEIFETIKTVLKGVKELSVAKIIVISLSLFVFIRLYILFFGGTSNALASLNDSSLIIEVVSYIIMVLVVLLKPEKKKHIVLDTINKSNEINKSLEYIRTRHDADYVSISLFHNGTVTFNRIHLLKMSRLFEAYSNKQVSRISLRTTENYPTLPYYNTILEMVTKGYIYIPDAENYDNKAIKDTLKFYEIRSALYLPLYTDELIGFMVWEWENPTDFTKQEINAIRDEYKQIQHHFID